MKKTMLALASVLGLALVGCGGDGGGGGGRALCIESCEKVNECFEMESDCEAGCDMDNGGDQECSNAGEIADHIEMCNAGECGDMGMTYSECVSMAPACEM